MPDIPHSLFLSSLAPESREWLVSRATPVTLSLRSMLIPAEVIPQYGYIMTSGIASVVTAMPDGATAEVGLMGREAVVGSMHLLGPAKVTTDCFMQVPGTALRVRYADLQQAFRSSEEIRGRILEFVQEHTLGVCQTAACNRLHEAEERLARWLLMVRDRTETDSFLITQEFLAQMLGSRRTTVTVVAGALQRAGLIEYQRGRVQILDHANLEAAACACYAVNKALYSQLYKIPHPSSSEDTAPNGAGQARR